MKPCQVEATFTSNGNPRPRKFVWNDYWLNVIDIGREWTDDDGKHILVRVADGRAFELLYNGSGWRGKATSMPPNFV